MLLLRRTAAYSGAAPSGDRPCRPRDNPEFRIIAAIRTIRRVSYSATLDVPFATPSIHCFRIPHESAFSSLVTVSRHYVYSMYLLTLVPTIYEIF